MKNLLAIVAAVMTLPACVIEDTSNNTFCGDGFLDAGEACDDGNNAAGDGCSAVCTVETADQALITANWQIQNVAGTTTGCPPGFDTAALYSQLVDTNGTAIGQPIIDLFNCTDRTGVTMPLAPGLYQSWVEITNTDGSSVYAQSSSAYVDVTTADKTFSVTILNDGGYFDLTWNLVQAGTNAPLTCQQVAGLNGVGVISTSVANQSNFFDDQFTCTDYYGITGGLLAGVYTVSVDAMSAGGSLGTAPTLTNRLVLDKNRITNLGNVTIPVN